MLKKHKSRSRTPKKNHENSKKPSKTHRVKAMLLVKNLSKNVTMENVEEVFSFFGRLLQVDMPVDEKNNNLPLQFAFVHYEHEGDAD